MLRFRSEREPELVRISTCHRDVFLKDDLDEEFSYEYVPAEGIEDSGSCILQVAAFDSQGFHEFGAVDFVDDETMSADLYCNGEYLPDTVGASVCQARAAALQVIKFRQAVELVSRDNCPEPYTVDSKLYSYPIKEGYCIYLFFNAAGEMHRHTTFGYNGDIRE
jgi:hypothetical protein